MNINDLDIVLNVLDDVENRPSLTYQQVFDLLDGHTYTDKQLDLILAKLVKDGFVNKKYASDGKLALFHITYDGHIFIKNKAYSELIKSQKREKRRQIILDYALIFGGVGAVIVAIPYIVKLLKFLFCGC